MVEMDADATWRRLVFEKSRRILEFEQRVLPSLRAADPQSVLEVGCGMGYAAALLKGACPWLRVVASDVSPVYLARHSRRVGAIMESPADAYVACGAVALPFRRAAFDAVYSAMLLYALPDPSAAIREFLRVGRRWLGLEAVSPRFGHDGQADGRRYSLGDWQQLVRSFRGSRVSLLPSASWLRRRAALVRRTHVLLEIGA